MQELSKYDKDNPKRKYGLAVFLFFAFMMYEMKKEEGEQRTVEELIESLRKSETDTIELVRYINTMKNSDKQ
jgi:hypothetical protein